MVMLLWMLVALGLMTAQDNPAPKKELQRPADWVTRADAAGTAGVSLYFVSMPPGWHITTGPGTILYDAKRTCTGRCRIEAEIYLFPGQSEGGYGVFLGGNGLDAKEGPNYQALLVRRDGAVMRTNWVRGERVPGSSWEPAFAGRVVPGAAEPVKNVIALEVDGLSAKFFVNGHMIRNETHRPESPLRQPFDGVVGLRVDADVNLHVTRLDVTTP